MEHHRTMALIPDSAWVGLLLVTLGVCGLLDAAGVVDSSQTIGQWWPLAIVAWAVIDMVKGGGITWWGIVWSAIGVALLADEQGWTSGGVIWSALAVVGGGAMLTGAVARRGNDHGAPGDKGPDNTSDAPASGGWERYRGWTR